MIKTSSLSLASMLMALLLLAGLTGCQEGEEDAAESSPTSTPKASTDAAQTPSPGEDVATPQASSPETDLPAAAEGYEWFVTPKNGASNDGLPLYAVQIPIAYTRSPAGPFYGNPEQFVADTTTQFSTRIMVKITPADAVMQFGFESELPWQGGGLCDILSDRDATSAVANWKSYRFGCPESEAGQCVGDSQTMTFTCVSGATGAPVPSFGGRAAETRIGNFVHSIVVFRPGDKTDAEPAFDQAISSFTLR